jgi:hypothetical protein
MRHNAGLSPLILVRCLRACPGKGRLDVERTNPSDLLYLSVIVRSAIFIREVGKVAVGGIGKPQVWKGFIR